MTDEQEYPSPSIVDSRRLTGANLYDVHPGAVLEVRCDDEHVVARTLAWRSYAAAITESLGWTDSSTALRREPGGATLFLRAPVDALMTATSVCEQAWVLAESSANPAVAGVAEALRGDADAERATRPQLAAAMREAASRNLCTTFDDERLTIGGGDGAMSWALAAIPPAERIPWAELRDVPIALVTGSNGKTTTTRLVAAMWRAAGVTPGWSCSDGVWAGDAKIESGDYSGPAGARVVLRDSRVGAAILETARGGILRRGLAVSRADAAIITNLSADHFGEYGMTSVDDLAEVKAVVASVLGGDGCLVLNADDALLGEIASRRRGRLAWFSVAADHPALDEHVLHGGDAATVHDGRAMLHRSGVWHDLGALDAMPITLRGAAPHNVQNLLGAALLASVLGISVDAIRGTLAAFGAQSTDNPGRLQLYRFGGLTVLVDYAHNPDGLAALCRTANAIPARRRALLLGQAGNRDDEQVRALPRTALSITTFDLVIVKEEPAMLRGRQAGDVPRILLDELHQLGLPDDQVVVTVSELDAMRRAFEWARDGDLLVCPIHVAKTDVLAWLARLAEMEWRPGTPLPA